MDKQDYRVNAEREKLSEQNNNNEDNFIDNLWKNPNFISWYINLFYTELFVSDNMLNIGKKNALQKLKGMIEKAKTGSPVYNVKFIKMNIASILRDIGLYEKLRDFVIQR